MHCVTAQISPSDIAANRIVQKYHDFSHLTKIHESDQARLHYFWNYLSASYTFQGSSDVSMTLDQLMNVLHFDVYEFEKLRLDNESYTFHYKNQVSITLLSKNSMQFVLGGYTINELLFELPARALPMWTATQFTNADFENYKEQLWDWAKDFPELYLELTSDTSIPHVRFNELANWPMERKTAFLSNSIYFIID